MFISHLRLTDVRSYESADLSFQPGVTVFLGPNGYGKTNIVEAIHFLATLGSHRVASDQPLIKAGATMATITARVQAGLADERSLSVAIDIRQGAPNKALLNRAPVRPREVIGAVRTVFFAPEDLAIVRGDPSERRDFIDELITSRWPRLAGVRSEYDRVQKQKTTLLKAMSGRSLRQAGAGAEATLAVWDQQVADLGGQIVAARLTTLAELAPMVAAAYDAIAPVKSAATVAYQSSSVPPDTVPDATVVSELLAARIAERSGDEVIRGVCLVGPHRDDIGLSLGQLPVKGYASHGEGWSFALALRLASLELLQADGIDPILILDDVFAELDEHRRARVVAAMESVEQTFITTAVERDLPANLFAHVYAVTPGHVERVSEGDVGRIDESLTDQLHPAARQAGQSSSSELLADRSGPIVGREDLPFSVELLA
ncbi:MAG: DNA replication/repair protein RecF, partial [Propionibacteriaceae bacterium]|nr:DNA replication/repair protein RecF [Propionibacteriaceae bacterium]